MVQSIRASHTLQAVIGLNADLLLTFRAKFGLALHLNSFDSLIDGISYRENDVINEHEETEEVDKGYEDDENRSLPLDDGR